MAKAQANASVYKRLAAKLGPASNGTGAIDPAGNIPGGVYKRQAAGSAGNGKVKYVRKTAK